MKTVHDLLTLSWEFAKSKNPNVLRRDVEELIAHRLGMKRLDLYVFFDRPIEEKELPAIRDGLKRLIQDEPLEYIVGECTFSGCRIKVTKDVLIPRPETEWLVEKIVTQLKEVESGTFLDLCCGSGYIGIAVKKKLPQLQVLLSDISPAALAIARENAKVNDVEVSFLEGDLFQPLQKQMVDFLACNPPYISQKEFSQLDPSVAKFEPHMALVSGPTGLEMYERLAREVKQYVKESVFLEIGATQGKAVADLFHAAGYQHVQVCKDLSDHDRYVIIS
ncbi:MAG TPA: peptide chain release factor N(5)-glutamine methyltransferase [Chlamydiales bacterium]|nr:peptide chain release factor N(5)-glutamine methyltransferase [Chlamydiales bacterium]